MAKAGARGIRAGRAFVELLGDDTQLAKTLKGSRRRLNAFSASVSQVGAGLLTMGAGLATPMALSARSFANFEQAMARVLALTGATQSEFASLEAAARRLGETTVFTATEAAEAMSYFALAGFKVADILASVGPTLDMAAAGQLGIAEAADIAVKIMAGMGIEAANLSGAVDVLTKAMTTANTDLRQLGDAMKYVGPIAKSAGISFEETVAAIQLLSNAGIQADMAGTSLRGVLLSLTNPSKEAADTMERLGIRVADAEGNVRSLAAIIADLERATAGMGSAERLAVLGTMFDNRQAAGMAELLTQGADRLREFTAALEGADGTAARIAAIQLNTMGGAAKLLTSALDELRISIGEALSGPLRVGLAVATNVVRVFTRWAKANKGLVVAIAAVGAVSVAAGGALLALGLAAKVAAVSITGLFLVMGAAKIALAAVLTPAGLIVTALAAVGVAAYLASDRISQVFGWLAERIGRLQAVVHAVMQGMRDAIAAGDVEGAAQILWLGLQLAWTQGTTKLLDIWGATRTALLSSMNTLARDARLIWTQVFAALKSTAIRFRGGSLGEQMAPFADAAGDIGQIHKEADAVLAAINAARAAEESALSGELERAKAALDEAIRKAAAARAALDTGGDGSSMPAWIDTFGDIASGIARSAQTFGQFGGVGAAQLVGGDGLEAEQLAEQRRIGNNTGRMVRAVERLDSRLAFG